MHGNDCMPLLILFFKSASKIFWLILVIDSLLPHVKGHSLTFDFAYGKYETIYQVHAVASL